MGGVGLHMDKCRPSPLRVPILIFHVIHILFAFKQVTGVHTGGGHNDFLPFITRFYVSAGATSLRTVHFFMYDGDQNKDFIKGIVRELFLNFFFYRYFGRRSGAEVGNIGCSEAAN